MIECTIFGGVVLVRFLEMEQYPKRGQDGLILQDFDIAGGCSINMAVTFNNLGGNGHVVSFVGSDPGGEEILDYMTSNGLSVKHVKRVTGETGYCLVILEKDGERTFLTKKGVECTFDPSQLTIDEVNINNIMVTGYFLLSDDAAKVIDCLERARKNCRNFLFDPGPLVGEIKTEILERILGMANVITANEVEVKRMKLPKDTDKLLVIKKGSSGGDVHYKGNSFTYRAAKVDAVDTTGAGDSFAAGLLFGLASGMDVKQAVELAVESSAKTMALKGPHGFWKR